MKICVSKQNKHEIEPTTVCFEPEELTHGKNIKDAIHRLGIREDNYINGKIIIKDAETGVQLSFPIKSFDDFLNITWHIRQKFRRKRK